MTVFRCDVHIPAWNSGFVRKTLYMSPQHGSLELLVSSSSGALSFSSGGSPLDGVKYTVSRCSDAGDSSVTGSLSRGSADAGNGAAGCFCSLAAALCRLRSASVWLDLSLLILSSSDVSWYEAMRSMRPPLCPSPGREDNASTLPLPSTESWAPFCGEETAGEWRPDTCGRRTRASVTRFTICMYSVTCVLGMSESMAKVHIGVNHAAFLTLCLFTIARNMTEVAIKSALKLSAAWMGISGPGESLDCRV